MEVENEVSTTKDLQQGPLKIFFLFSFFSASNLQDFYSLN